MSLPVQLRILRLPHSEGLPLPDYATIGAAGLDLRAAVQDDVILQPKARALVATGLIFQIPENHEAQIRPRSGLAFNHGVTLINAPGTIDWDYRGEVKIALINLGENAFTITRGLRIAQLVIAPVTRVECIEIMDIDATKRGTGGFGSTGLG